MERKLLVVVASLLFCSHIFAQAPVDLGNGFKPWGSYDGTQLDSVSLENGNLILHAPIIPDYPERGGKIASQERIFISSHNWKKVCDVNDFGDPINCYWKGGGTGVLIEPVGHFSVGRKISISSDPDLGVTYADVGEYVLTTWDGANHELHSIPASTGALFSFISMDGTGYRLDFSNPDENGIAQNVTVIDRQGTRHLGTFGPARCGQPSPVPPRPAGGYARVYDQWQISPTICVEHSQWQTEVDPNGNIVSFPPPGTSDTSTFLDTMGRPSTTFQPGGLSDAGGCVNTQPFAFSMVFSYASVGGAQNQIKTCYGALPIQTSFGYTGIAEFQAVFPGVTFSALTTIILPNGTKWVFNYDSYGDLTSISLPTGGSITYLWNTIPAIDTLCNINGNHWYASPVIRAVIQRTVTDNNGHTSTWTYHWGSMQPDNSVTNWVTDPEGDDTVHVFKPVASTQCFGSGMNASGPGLREVTTQYWQGAKDSGALLKQVETTYGRAAMMANEGGFSREANPVPTDIQTTLYPSDKVNLIHKDYDSLVGANGPTLGNVISEKVYDWGFGGHGNLLRETDTVYQWQKDSAYLAAHLVDLPASTVVISPVAAENTKSFCPVTPATSAACAAETDYSYDEVPVLPHLGTPPPGTLGAPPNPVRGNLTTISRWLNTTNGLVSIQNSWFDTGMLAETKDPLGHSASYNYDPTETYVTQTCNAKNQCVYGSYDFNTGLLTSFTDANGGAAGDFAHTTNYGYDSATARLLSATMPPDPSGSRAQTNFSYSDLTQPNTFPITVTRTQPVTGSLTDSTTTTFDGLGRPYTTEHAMPSGPPATIDTQFDAVGRVATVSNPYFSVSDPTYGVTSTTYDALDRAIAVTKQDGSHSGVDYSAGSCITSTDEAGNPRRTCSDALGRLIEVDEPAGGNPATSASGSLSITGTEQTTQVMTTPATSGAGNVQVGGTVQWKSVSNSSTGGTTSITINGGEQQYPAGVIAGSGTISFSGSEQIIPALAGSGAISIGGTLQSTQVQIQAATKASGSVTISGAEQSKTVQGDRYCADYSINGMCVDWEYNSSVVADAGSVTVTVNSHADSVTFDASTNNTTATIASALASTINADTAASVTATVSGSTVYLTSKSTGTGANMTLASSYTWDSTDFTSSSFTTSNSGATLTGGQNAVMNTIYDSGTCTVTISGHSDSNSWSGSATTAAGIASALAGNINADTLAQVTATVSGTTISLAAKATGAATNYPLSSSCSHDTAHFGTGSFTSSSGTALTGGRDQINDGGSFTVTVNGHASPASNWGLGSTAANIASDVVTKINNDTAAAVTASASGSTVTLTAKIKGSISNYSFSVAPTYDSVHFAHASFSNSNSGAALTGGWPNPTAVDSGTMTVTVNAKPYTVNWGASDTPGSIASNLATALAADTTVTPTLSGTIVYLNPKQAGTAYSFSTAYTYDTADFTQSSFNTANAISDWGSFSITAGGHTNTVPWAGLSSASTIASALANSINGDSLAVVRATASTSTVSLTAKTTGTTSNYSLASSAAFDSTHFTASSFSGTNSGAALTGGANAVYTTAYDSGTVTLSIGGSSYSATYKQGDTAATVATNLATAVSKGGMVKATASGSTLSLTANAAGEETNYSLSGSSTSGQTNLFPSASFAASILNPSMSGGADQVPGSLASPLVTLYTYDVLGDLLCVEQHGDAATGTGCASDPSLDVTSPWRVRRFTYDSLGRLLTASNPESNTAIDATGTVVRVPTRYAYDADGNLLMKTSPAANQAGTATQTISYCYDELHRVIAKDYQPHTYTPPACPITAPVVTYTYDVGANAIGHLTGVTDQAGSASYSYDVLGRLSSETRVINGISKSLSYDYNLNGSLKALHYPSGAVVTYLPDSAGRMVSAIDTGNGVDYVTGAIYGPDGQMTGFASGDVITSAFSYNKRLQPVNMSANTALQTVFSIGYDFHVGNGTAGTDNGNVWSIYNYRDRTRDQSFTYDALNRLLTAQNAGTDCTAPTVNGKTEYWGNSYSYDAWGNLTRKNITKCGAENLTLTALVNNQLSGYGYDAAGNMTSDPTDATPSTYDPENRIVTAATPSGTFTYTYDADGNRVEKSGNGTGTLYWYMTPGIIGESDLSGTMKSEYVFFNGERVARRDLVAPGGVFYYFSDHLKTASVITDSAGNIKSESDYYPWGGELQFVSNDSNHYKFTGKERDSESGLDYFGARYYSNGLGRFITPDWAAKAVDVPYAEFSDPQSLNLYSYVRNIPTARFDGDGHCDSGFVCDIGKGIMIGLQRANDLVDKATNAVNSIMGRSSARPGGDAEAAETGRAIAPETTMNAENKTQEVTATITAVVVPALIPGEEEFAPVEAYEVGTYGELSSRSLRDGLSIDHIPSNASNIARKEAELGRALTPAEKAAVRNQGTAVAVPTGLHQSASPTFGGRNTPAQIAADAANPQAAAIRDTQAMVNAASDANKANAQAAASKICQAAGCK